MSDDLSTTLCNIFLCCISSHGIFHGDGVFVNPGLHGNFFVFGLLGIINTKGILEQSRCNKDIVIHYHISERATRFLSLACLNADLYNHNLAISGVHLLSGLLSFLLSIQDSGYDYLSNICLSCNLVSLVCYSFKHKRVWGFYAAGAAMLGFLGNRCSMSFMYPLSLSVVEMCVMRLMVEPRET